MLKVAFDIGGTFTDVISVDERGGMRSAKVLSLLNRVGDDIVKLADDHEPDGEIERFAHATTICSNAIIEGRAARVGLLTTAGFRDTLELRSQRGPAGSVRNWSPPQPLIRRDQVVEVSERILADGSIDLPIDLDSVDRAIRTLVDQGVDAIAVCFINAYVNPVHERQAAERIIALAPGMTFCLSSDILPEVREYDRTSTVAVNTALIPVVNAYLDRLDVPLAPRSRNLHIMQSNGGIMTTRTARQRPMSMMESGPAAGALAASRLAAEMGIAEVLAFDMGGTTAKACYVANGKPSERASGQIAAAATVGGHSRHEGHTLRVPTVDLVEVGAGGGSIAWLDRGTIAVGPVSASADPGPVCYGRGGTEPTVTDANVVLGRINGDAIADGQLSLDLAAARRAITELGASLGLGTMETAYGITLIANAVMMRALRAVSTERGYDPRRCAMIAFGGAGPLHAAALAENVGISTVIVPPFAGVFSALGLLLAEHRMDYVASLVTGIDVVAGAEIDAAFRGLEQRARADYAELGIDPALLRFERQADLRYSYQIDELGVGVPEVALEALPRSLREAFEATHEREFGFVGNGSITLVNLRVRATTPADTIDFRTLAGQHRSGGTGLGRRDVYFGPEHGLLETAIVSREAIGEGRAGPMIVEDPDTTVVVPPNWFATVHDNGSLVLTHRSG